MNAAPMPVIVGLVLLIASIGVTVAGAQEQVIGQPQVDVYLPDNRVTPGEETTLQLYLANNGQLTRGGQADYVERVTTARGTIVHLDAGESPIDIRTQAIPVGNVPTGTTGPEEIALIVPEGTPPGTYDIPVEVTYSYTRIVSYGDGQPDYSENFNHQDESISIRVVDAPRFEIAAANTTTQIGDRGELAMTITNVGTQPARDARVSVTSTSDELVFGSNSNTAASFVGRWQPGETRRLTFALSAAPDAIRREYSLSTAVDYTDSDGVRQTSRELLAGVTPLAEQSFSLSEINSTLRVGQEGTISGTITNEGPSPIYEPVLAISGGSRNLDFLESEVALSRLEAGESRGFSFEADVSDVASAARQQFTFTVKYQNERGDDRTSSALRASLHVQPQRDRFTIEPVSASLERGGSGTITLRDINNGNEPITDVSVKTYFNDPLDSSDDEAFIPQLAPGESTEVEVAGSASGDALTKQYPVSVDLQYTMPDGDTKLSTTHKIAVDVVASANRGGLPVTMVVGTAALVGVVALVWHRRR